MMTTFCKLLRRLVEVLALEVPAVSSVGALVHLGLEVARPSLLVPSMAVGVAWGQAGDIIQQRGKTLFQSRIFLPEPLHLDPS